MHRKGNVEIFLSNLKKYANYRGCHLQPHMNQQLVLISIKRMMHKCKRDINLQDLIHPESDKQNYEICTEPLAEQIPVKEETLQQLSVIPNDFKEMYI